MDNHGVNVALVRAIKDYPCLYDNNLPAYCRKEITDDAWNKVATQIGIPAGECKEKWKNLRWGFIRSLRPNADGSARKKYYLHEQMEFVLPYIKLLPKTGSYTLQPNVDSDTEEENMQLLDGEFLEYEILENPFYKRARNHETETKQTTEKTESLKNGKLPQSSEIDVLSEPRKKRIRIHEPVTEQATDTDSRRMFLLSLLPEVNVLTEKQMRAFRRKIFQLIDDIVEDTKNKCDASEEQTPDSPPRFETQIIKTETLAEEHYLTFFIFVIWV
ncbi:hypothetical protein ABMA27_005538 [Loxostege sticticalis]|uniref:Transcription factor Adf-1 n=1 Tax=Loxostege sticticalis TaxID=481309 RepID=A0ABR3HJI9_LOXSC